MAKQEQAGLPGIPQPPKRKVIDAIEDKLLERDKLAGKRTALSDKIAETAKEIDELLGILQDWTLGTRGKRVKSKLNPKKGKADE
jgi:hypothetical protein